MYMDSSSKYRSYWQCLYPFVILVAAANRLAVTVDCLLSDSPAPKGDTWYLILRQLLNGRTKKDEGGDTAPPSVSG